MVNVTPRPIYVLRTIPLPADSNLVGGGDFKPYTRGEEELG